MIEKAGAEDEGHGDSDENSVIMVTLSLKAKIHGNGWEPQLTWEPVLWAQVNQILGGS